MTTLTLQRTGRQLWTLTTAMGTPRGMLRTGRGLMCAEATAADGTWSVRAHGPRRLRVTAGPPGVTALELDAPSASGGVAARWETSRGFRHYRGLLTYASASVAARTSTRPGAPVEVEMVGHHPDLVMLTVCFALLSRRRQDGMRALWVAAMTSHGPR